MESFLACSTNPQVLTTMTSGVASSASRSTSSQPLPCSRPASSSESTSLRAQPRVSRATPRRGEVGNYHVARVLTTADDLGCPP